jgi:hypothetical protein
VVFALLVDDDFVARRKGFDALNNRLFVNKTFFAGNNKPRCPACVKIVGKFGIADNRTVIGENRFQPFEPINKNSVQKFLPARCYISRLTVAELPINTDTLLFYTLS